MQEIGNEVLRTTLLKLPRQVARVLDKLSIEVLYFVWPVITVNSHRLTVANSERQR